jgi:methanogenic corrinoid protein MtbC1
MLGGAPVSQAFSDQIRADGYAPHAALWIDLVKKLVE